MNYLTFTAELLTSRALIHPNELKNKNTMAVYYDLVENPNPKGDGEKQALHPRIVVKQTIKTDRLLKEIAYSASLTEGDLQAALAALEEKLSYYLNDGYNVQLGNIGYFSASLKARPVMEKSEIRSMSIRFNGVNFKASSKFLKRLKGEFIRDRFGFQKSSKASEEERVELVKSFLADHPFISRKEYTQLTGRLRTTALNDLNEWVEKGFLKTYGKGNRKVYLKGGSTE